jgi:hypothetical protein
MPLLFFCTRKKYGTSQILPYYEHLEGDLPLGDLILLGVMRPHAAAVAAAPGPPWAHSGPHNGAHDG